MKRNVVILLCIAVILVGVMVSGSYAQKVEKCDMCGKPVTPTTKVTIEYVDKTEVYCCPHCTLIAIIIRKLDLDSPQIKAVTVTDYKTKAPLDPSETFFTYGGTDVPCCAPPIIAFANRSDAEEHVERFGGEVLTISSLAIATDCTTPGHMTEGICGCLGDAPTSYCYHPSCDTVQTPSILFDDAYQVLIRKSPS